jgi:soluble lytic murein transglycosylase-like protein
MLLLFFPSFLSADIYMYVDENGVRHFSNVPTTGKFKLFLKKKKASRFTMGRSTTRYDRLISSASRKHKVAFPLVKAVIKAESDFNPRAVSRKGARGLMQIMPENNSALNIANAFDPAQNIMGGSYYLKKLLIRYKNRLALALAAYNAGPEAVDRYRQIPPFGETQAYVRKVMGLYNRYKEI